jgi:four helix bundle protein
MKLEELKVYNLSMDIAEEVWVDVSGWDFFAKDTIGKQLIRAIDSVAANLSEGFGRFHYNDTKKFGYYSRGSLYESKTWLTKAKNRGLISTERFSFYAENINIIGKMLNKYIKSVGDNVLHEPTTDYFTKGDDDLFQNND